MDLSLQLVQKQILSQRMQQSVEILQMNTIMLTEYIHELAQENPLLECQEAPAEEPVKEDKLLRKLEWLEEADEQNRSLYRVEQEDEEERGESFGKQERESLREYLLFQINILKVEDRVKRVLRFLAQSTEESGYLEKGALEAAEKKYHLKGNDSKEILGILQSFDPPGVGARDLQDCLLIQLRQKNASAIAIAMVETYLLDLARNRRNYVAKQLRVSPEEIKAAFEEIKSCEPKPGCGFLSEEPVEYILPDVFVNKTEGELVVTVNGGATPRLFVNQSYVKLLREGAAEETRSYISNKLRQAEWAVQCISKRENTLLETAKCIVQWQEAFFMAPDGLLKPLRLADVAERIQMHESTVSRAVKDKYLQCDRGIFPLHSFFSKALYAEGEGTVSADSIQQKLRLMIDGENKKKPYSDRELTEKLREEGIQISRRTVAKYREGMGIAGAPGRKRFE